MITQSILNELTTKQNQKEALNGSWVFNAWVTFSEAECKLFQDIYEGEDLWFVLDAMHSGDPDGDYPDEQEIWFKSGRV